MPPGDLGDHDDPSDPGADASSPPRPPSDRRAQGHSEETVRVVPQSPGPPEDRIQMPADDPRRYEISDTLGEGGLGKTFVAYDRRLGRTIALKELLHHHPDDRARFVREALITARLEHPAIVPVYDVGQWASGEPFYLMRRVHGRSLAEIIRHSRTLDQRLALLPHLIAVADAVAYAHSHHVIHRDLKPSNILIGPFGETVVIDWGLAKDLRRGDEPPAPAPIPEPLADGLLTQTGIVMGTPAYMPPEQAAGDPVDERADVYALGAILYELLSGRLPYTQAPDPAAPSVVTQVLAAPPTSVEKLQPGVPPDLAALVKKAMARDPTARYPTARELAEDLRNFQTGRLVSAHHYSRPTLARRWLRRHRLPVLISSLALMALSSVGLLSVRRIIAARRLAEHRAAQLLLSQARGALERDPTEALAWLRTYLAETTPPDDPDEARALAIEAQSRGVARHVLPQAGFYGFTADGRAWIEARDGQHIDLRDLTSGALLHRLAVPEGIHKIAISPDRRHLAILNQPQDTLLLHDLAQPHTERLPLDGVHVHELSFSPDGTTLATGDNHGAVHLWPLQHPRSPPRLLGSHPDGVLYLSYSRDGRWIISSSEEPLTARLWQVDGPAHQEVRGPPRTRAVAELSPDASHLAIGAPDGTLTLVDLRQGTRRLLGQHPAPFHHLHYAPDGAHLATATDDGLITLWPLSLAPGVEPHRLTPRHAAAALRVRFTPDGRRLLSASRDGEVRLWERETGAYQTLGRVYGRVTGIDLAPGGHHAAVTTLNMSARLWELPPERGRALPGHTDDVYQILYAPDGHTLVSTSRDLSLHWWRLPAGPHGALQGHRDTAFRIALLPDGEIRLWHKTRGTIQVLRGPRSVIRALAFSPDGHQLASGDERGELWRWDLSSTGTGAGTDTGTGTGTHEPGPGRLLPGTGKTIENLAYAPDGRHLASADRDGAVRLWQTETGALRVLGHHEGAVRDVAFAPDGHLLASAGEDGSLQLFELPSGAGHLLGRHHERIYKLAFAPDGAVLASASQDHSVRLWHIPTRSLLQILWHEHEATYVTFAPDGHTLAVAGTGGTVRLWPVDRTTMDRTTMDRTTPPSEPAALRTWLLGLSTATLGPRQQLATPPAN